MSARVCFGPTVGLIFEMRECDDGIQEIDPIQDLKHRVAGSDVDMMLARDRQGKMSCM